MSDTPETDAVIAADLGDSGFIRNLCGLSRKLERERDEARKERDALKESLSEIKNIVSSDSSFGEVVDALWGKPMDELEAERNSLRAEVNRLRNLRETEVDLEMDSLDRERDELRAELERLKAQSREQNRCMNQLRELWKHLPDIENKYDERIAYHLDELIERLKADKARLDWLDSFNNTVTIQCEDGGIWIEIEDYKKVNDEPEKSLRDAIDAAMKGAE